MKRHDFSQRDIDIYKVEDEPYSMWLELGENPRWWKDAENIGPEIDYIACIKQAWTDIKPFSLLTERLMALKTKLSYVFNFRQKRSENDDSVLSHMESHL